MSTFSKIWNKEVKRLAETCIQEPRYVELMSKDKSYKPTQEEKTYIKWVYENYKDTDGMYYISKMIWNVEHALADGIEPKAELAVARVYEVLDRPSYFKNVFNNDENDKEWKTRAALRDGLKKLLNV